MSFREKAAELEADLGLWQKLQRKCLDAGDIDGAKKCATAIKENTTSAKALMRERAERLVEQLEAAIEQQARDAAQAKALDEFADEMRHVPKH